MHTRRHFIKVVMLGTASGLPGCGTGEAPRSPPAPSAKPRSTRLSGERFETCHAVRDGQSLPRAEISASHDVVIVGGGPSGLSAAHSLRDLDLLLLEKEDVFGGSCSLDEWQGVRLSTGGAFYTESEDDLVAFFAEIGAAGMKVEGQDSIVVDGQPTTDFFRDGANRLPFPQKARDDFRRSREELRRLLQEKGEALDRVTFAELLEPYDPLLTRFWDRFGPSNWGGTASETSGFIGAEAYSWAGGMDDPRWTFPGGMAGGAQALASWLAPKLGERLRSGAAVYSIEREERRKTAIVRYLKDGQPFAVRARAVVVATPKLYATHIVRGLPEAQLAAMRACRYAPFLVLNVCLRSPGPEPAYDNWFLDTPFTDFIPADWILHAGKGPRERRTALTVYHPLGQDRRKELLVDPMVLEMADAVAEGLERHFPGTLAKIEEIRAFRRGHPMCIPAPGRLRLAAEASRGFGPVLFANTDSSASVPSFDGAYLAARRASAEARKILRA